MPYTYLALGDSYTIGEAVAPHERFPAQLVQMLQQDQILFSDPHIIAQTGWTTGELTEAIRSSNINEHFDLVTLLIGVNNQYRGLDLEAYKNELEALVQTAITFARNNNDHVIIISIPDWGVTPYATGRNRDQIAGEIDMFNQVKYELSQKYQLTYVDITPGSRKAADDNNLLADDGLHPSGVEYERWAGLLRDIVNRKFKQSN